VRFCFSPSIDRSADWLAAEGDDEIWTLDSPQTSRLIRHASESP